MKLIVLLLLSLVVSNAASAQDSPTYAKMGRSTWSAFACSALAAHIKNSKEQERLFHFGLSQGREFIAAVQAGKVRAEDLNSGVPVGLLWLLEGPSIDFMLGRIFEAAMDNALEDVFRTGEKFNDDELQKLLASNKFQKSNCELVGNAR